MTTATKHKASYWVYRGNHPDGHDCYRHNEHGYPMGLVQWMHHYRPEGTTIKQSKKGQFGGELTIYAPVEVWEKSWIECAKEIGMYINFDAVLIDDDDEKIWGLDVGLHEDQILTELFYRGDDETELEMVKKGYVPTNEYHNGKQLWMKHDLNP